MALFAFETITASQALAYLPTDSLAFAGPAFLLRVAFQADQAAITQGAQTVTFGPGILGDTDLTALDGGVVFVGTPGADAFGGGAAFDALFGGMGADLLNGDAAGDLLQGNQGADTLLGGPGNDTVFGGQDADMIVLGFGADEANFTNGNLGDDTITAGNGGDTLLGGQGADLIFGGAGADLIFGNLGDDIIDAGAGADIIFGDAGYDIFRGGIEGDLYVFPAGSSVIDVILSDRILDWTPADMIDLAVGGGYGEVEATPPAPPVPVDPNNPYGYATLDEFTIAQNAAAMALAGNPALSVVATQAGADVVVFIDSEGDHLADMAVILSNTTLASISEGNFI